MLLSPDSEFFRYFRDATGAPVGEEAPADEQPASPPAVPSTSTDTGTTTGATE
jgi:hypothetical protein